MTSGLNVRKIREYYDSVKRFVPYFVPGVSYLVFLTIVRVN